MTKDKPPSLDSIVERKKTKEYPSLDKKLSIEAFLERLGGFSWFQLWATVVTISPEISAAMISLSPVLTGSHQFCDNETATISIDDIGCVKTSSFPGALKSVVQEWSLVGNHAWISDLFTSFQMFGALVGSLVAGELAERRGRKTAHFVLCFLMGTFGFTSGLAPDPYTFCVLRFFAGFAIGGCYVVYLNYLMEFLTPSWRTVCGCVSLWCVGEMLLAVLAYVLSSWRQTSWATSAPVFLVFLAYPFMPESPRWLLCQGRTEEAIEVFEHIARWNGKSPLDPSEIKALQRDILLSREEETESSSISSTTSTSTTNVYLNEKRSRKGFFCSTASFARSSFNIFKYPEYRFQLFILIFSWFTSQLIYYGISFNMKNLSGDPYLNVFYMGVVGLPGSFAGLLFNNRLGRRTTIIGFFAISFCLLVALITISETTNLGDEHPTIIVFLCLSVRLFAAAGFAVLSCFTAESFPTVVRVRCMGMCALFGNVGGILAPQFVFISTIIQSAQYVTFAFLSLATIGGALYLREMTGKPLEDFLTSNNKNNGDKTNSNNSFSDI